LGIAEISVPFLSWGDAFLDYDNDGWKDLLMSDGHVYPEADKYNWGTSWARAAHALPQHRGQEV
jgi:enediyne biosynthesis protein E4